MGVLACLIWLPAHSSAEVKRSALPKYFRLCGHFVETPDQFLTASDHELDRTRQIQDLIPYPVSPLQQSRAHIF